MPGSVTPTIPILLSPNSTEDPKTRQALITLRDALNAVLTPSNLLDGGQLATGTVPNSALATLAVNKLANGTSGQLIIAGASAPAYKTISGDVSVDATGAMTIDDGAVTSRKFNPTASTISQTSDLNLTTIGFTNVPGALLSITPSVVSQIIVTATFEMSIADTGHNIANGARGYLAVDGVPLTGYANANFTCAQNPTTNNALAEATVSRSWITSLSVGAHNVRLQAGLANSPLGTATVTCKNSSFTYMVVGT